VNARQEAGKIYSKLAKHVQSPGWNIKGGYKRRQKVIEWLKYYGVDAQWSPYRRTYTFIKRRSMGAPINNPYMIGRHRVSRETFKRYLKAFPVAIPTKNPLSPRQVKAMRLADKIARRIYHASQAWGVQIPVPRRTPKLVKRYLRFILKTNGIQWKIK